MADGDRQDAGTPCDGQDSFPEAPQVPKEKLEQARREKSRQSAKSRRDQESQEIFHLSQLIPISNHITDSLDKSTILRLSFCFLRLKGFFGEIESTVHRPIEDAAGTVSTRTETTKSHCKVAGSAGRKKSVASSGAESPELSNEQLLEAAKEVPTTVNVFTESSGLLSALSGFLMVVSADGCIIYVSTNIRTLLGIRDVEMMGNKISDFVSPEDYPRVQPHLKKLYQNGIEQMTKLFPEELGEHHQMPEELAEIPVAAGTDCSFSVHMKSNSEKKTSSKAASSHASMVASNKASSYELVRITGRYFAPEANPSLCSETSISQHSMVLLCRPIEQNIGMTPSMMFRVHHGMDLTFSDYNDKFEKYVGYTQSTLQGKTLYSIVHPEDALSLQEKHTKLVRGHEDVVTLFMRYMLQNRDNLWVQVVLSAVRNPKGGRATSILATNYVVSHEGSNQWHSLVTKSPAGEARSSTPELPELTRAPANPQAQAQPRSNRAASTESLQLPPLQSAAAPAPHSPSISDGQSFLKYQNVLQANPGMAGHIVVDQFRSESGRSQSESEPSSMPKLSEPPAKRRCHGPASPPMPTGRPSLSLDSPPTASFLSPVHSSPTAMPSHHISLPPPPPQAMHSPMAYTQARFPPPLRPQGDDQFDRPSLARSAQPSLCRLYNQSLSPPVVTLNSAQMAAMTRAAGIAPKEEPTTQQSGSRQTGSHQTGSHQTGGHQAGSHPFFQFHGVADRRWPPSGPFPT